MIIKSAKYILEEIRREDEVYELDRNHKFNMYEIINLVNKLSEEIKYNINKNKRYIYKLGINNDGEEEGISNDNYNIIMRVIDLICTSKGYIISNINSKFIDETLELSVYEIIITK
jgi:hypothetical protein